MNEIKGIARELGTQIFTLGGFVILMWAIEIIDQALGGQLDQFGIIPRNEVGLRGIFLAPLLHGSFRHLIANTIPFVSLGWLVMLQRTSDFWAVTAIAAIIGGLGTWLIGASNSVHIGASGVIFGYLGFLLSRGYFERNFVSMALSVLVGVLYGGLIWGVLPQQSGVSWEGHLFGFIGGIVAAKLLATPRDYD
ncbi:MAG: rhomboid family intramembrane serine protease [Oculatellaceae cyanobacterium Prado106]|jgi:membrane associated rhomboid family serine protease|nr:rhomboid family intramembrane serine protease [Oculatellaceae cyanobacterium Prado106]